MQRGAQPLARLDRGDEALLIGEHGLEPDFAEERVARSEAIVERTLGRSNPLGDEIDGYGFRPALGNQPPRRVKEVRMIESRVPHAYRLYGLDSIV